MWARRSSIPIRSRPIPSTRLASLNDLLADLDSGAVELLLILGGNPVFNAPVEWNVGERLARRSCACTSAFTKTKLRKSANGACRNRILSNRWGDGRAYDGTVTLQQPLIEPLYGGRAANEILAMFTDIPLRGSMDIVKGYWAGTA